MAANETYQLIDAIFRPQSIAVVGASANAETAGFDYLQALRNAGFQGPVYPVNPKGGEILGLPAYASLRDIPGPVDYVICCTPNTAVLDVVTACAEKGARTLQLFTARFGETGRPEGADLEKRLLAAARQANIRIIGPNCMGLVHPGAGMSFRPDMDTRAGPIGFLSQSGNLLFEMNHFGGARGIRFSKAISYGNALDLNESDFLDYFAEDPESKVIGAYIEGVKDGRRFFQALKLAAARKPVVVLKGGRTVAGGRNAASHTAALAGAGEVWEAAVEQAGAVSVGTVEALMDLLVGLAYMKPGSGKKLAMVGAGGGRSVLTADLCEEIGLHVPPLPEDVELKVAEKAPDLAGWVTNPVDQSILAGSGVGGTRVLEWLDESPGIDLLVANIGEPWAFGRPDSEGIISHLAERFIAFAAKTQKPFAVTMGPSDYPDERRWRIVSEAREKLVGAGVALFPSVERAVRTLARTTAYWAGR